MTLTQRQAADVAMDQSGVKTYELAELDLWGAALDKLKELHPELRTAGCIQGGLFKDERGRIVATVYVSNAEEVPL